MFIIKELDDGQVIKDELSNLSQHQIISVAKPVFKRRYFTGQKILEVLNATPAPKIPQIPFSNSSIRNFYAPPSRL